MFDIKCKKVSCEFNKNCNCNTKEINISKVTECKTFKQGALEKVSTESKIGQPPIRKDILVLCKANCLFNKNNQCIANGISVLNVNTDKPPLCCTFKPE